MKQFKIILAAGLISLISALPASAETKVNFVLDWAFQGNHGFFTLADDNGHFAKEGLKVKIDRGYGSGKTISQVAAGTYDIGFADINVLVKFNAKNPTRKVFSFYVVFDATLSAIVALSKSGIRTPKDLIGRKIAAPVWDNTRILFPIFAKANGIDPGSVKWQSVKPAIRDSLLLRGQTDAVAAFSTSVLLNLGKQGIPRKDIVVMHFSKLGADFFGSGLVVSEKYAAKNGEVLKAFVRAVIKGTRDSFADPKAAVASVHKRDSLTRESVELKRFAMVRELAVLTPSVKANGFSHVDTKRLERTIGYVVEAMKIKNPPPARDVFRADYLPPASLRMP